MKVNIGNFKKLKDGDFKLSQKAKSGILLGVFFIGLGVVHSLNSNKSTSNTLDNSIVASVSDYINNAPTDSIISDDFEIIEPYKQEDPINVSLEQINSLNIIINDCNCSEELITNVCEELSKDGIKFSLTKNCEDMSVAEAVVITLDQQYMAGPGTAVFAPFENNLSGNSDALALAAWRAFYEKGFLVDGVSCGQIGFKENEDGTVSERIPTPTEDAIEKNKDISFVTISFGTQNTHPGLVAAAIENMLTRFYAFEADNDKSEDLIYCVENGDSYDSVAEKIGSTDSEIKEHNNTIDKFILLPGETIIHPDVDFLRPFNQHVPINLYIEKTLWSK